MIHRTVFCLILLVSLQLTIFSHPLSAESSHKNHKWLIPVGAGAGFGLGLLIGLSAFDQAINSDQKVWTSAIVGGAIGGVGGWFAARRIDRNSEKTEWRSESIDEKIRIAVQKSSPYVPQLKEMQIEAP